jgi:hypothetical protein
MLCSLSLPSSPPPSPLTHTAPCELGQNSCKAGEGYDVEFCKIFRRIEENVILRNNYEFPMVTHFDTDAPNFQPHTNQGRLMYDVPGGGVDGLMDSRVK